MGNGRVASGLALLLAACGRGAAGGLWLADRGADELVALDGELCVRARVSVASPRLLRADPGGLWVASADSRAAPEPTTLVRLGREGERGGATEFSALVALCTERSGAALVLERVDAIESRLWRVTRELRRTLLGTLPAASALALDDERIVVGCAGGELVRLGPQGGVLGLAEVAFGVRALAPGPRAGECWVLGVEGTLALFARGPEPLWSVRTGLAARSLAPAPGAPRVWIAAGEQVRRYGPGGALEFACELAGGPWSAAAASADGVLLLGIGAVLELGPRGDVLRTQGGFDALSALAPVSDRAAAGPRPAASFRRVRAPAPVRGRGS